MIIEKNTSFHFFRVNKYSTMSPKPKNNTKINTKCYEKHNFFYDFFVLSRGSFQWEILKKNLLGFPQKKEK